MMVLLGHLVNYFKHSKICFSRSRNTNSCFRFWWLYSPNYYTAATEEYDGTSWTSSPGSLNTARFALGGAGTQTAALAFGGATGSSEFSSNRRMDRCRSTNNKNNNGKLIWQNI
jgi:hypothetical protein